MVIGTFKTIKTVLNATDEMAYLRSRDFLSLVNFPLLSTEFLDLINSRMVNKDVIVKITKGIILVWNIFVIMNIWKKPIDVGSHKKYPGNICQRFTKIGWQIYKAMLNIDENKPLMLISLQPVSLKWFYLLNSLYH